MQQKKLTLILNKIKESLKKDFYILFLIFSSIFFTFFSGYKGVFPIDSFLIYDAGYKVLNGFHPFKDYWSITGPILDYLQFLFFKLFGVNWLSYVLHAAFINLFLTIIFYFFFTQLSLSKFYCFIYALSASILAYPSVGTPFMDHHAVIFSLISIQLFILAIKKNNRIYWFLVPVFLTFSFLSKQIPSAYLVILIFIFIIILFFLEKSNTSRKIIYLCAGSILSILIICLIFLINRVPIDNFFLQYLLYPLEIGRERNSEILFNLNNTFFQFKFIYFSLVPLIYIFFKILFKDKKTLDLKKDFLILIFILCSIGIFLYSQILTKNQILIFFLIPFCLGSGQYFCNKYENKNFIKIFLITLLVISTVKYHIRFNVEKKFMELSKVNFSLGSDAKILDETLSGLLWITPQYPNKPEFELEELQELKNSLLSDNKNKIILSNYQFLPSIVGNRQIAPNKWFDVLSVPDSKSNYFNRYKDFFIQKLKEQKIERIYLTGNKKRYLKNIFKKNCYEIRKINSLSSVIEIEECLK